MGKEEGYCNSCECSVALANWEAHIAGRKHLQITGKQKKQRLKQMNQVQLQERKKRKKELQQQKGKGSLKRKREDEDEDGIHKFVKTDAFLKPNSVALGIVNFNKNDKAKTVYQTLDKIASSCRQHPKFSELYGGLKTAIDKNSTGWRLSGANSKLDDGARPKVLALDCEMVLCSAKPDQQDSEKKTLGAERVLARISLVEWRWENDENNNLENIFQGEKRILIDEYVRIPSNLKVVDYLTHVSGIEEKHLLPSNAKLSHEKIMDIVFEHLSEKDYLVGHSLWSDCSALKLNHGLNIIDTALLFGVNHSPNVTLSLKDLTVALLGSELSADFQKLGQSHDSVQDAVWSAKVLLKLMNIISAAEDKIQLPYMFDTLPERLLTRLTFHNLPLDVKEEHIHSLLNELEIQPDLYELAPIRWNKKLKSISSQGTCVVTFYKYDDTVTTFQKLPVAPSGCGGSDNSQPCCNEGWPDNNGFLRKVLQVNDKTIEVISYIRPEVSFEKIVEVPQDAVGKLMGPGGRRFIMMQQVTGAQIKLTNNQSKSKNRKNLSPALLYVTADSKIKIKHASKFIAAAVKGDKLGIL